MAWVRGKHIRLLAPGLHFWWPLTTEVEVIVTARQTLAIPDQVMVTKDGKKVVVKTLVVYRIPDPVRAIGKLNWDCDTTINDLTQSAVVRVVATHNYDEIMAGIRDEPDEDPDERDPPRVAAVRRPRHPLQAGGLCRLQGLQTAHVPGGSPRDVLAPVLSMISRIWSARLSPFASVPACPTAVQGVSPQVCFLDSRIGKGIRRLLAKSDSVTALAIS